MDVTDKIVEALIVVLETLLNSASLLLCVDPLLCTRFRANRNQLPRGEGADQHGGAEERRRAELIL